MRTQTENKKVNQTETTMKAAVIRQFGDADVLKVEEIERPALRTGHVLVKVLAAGVNRLDHYIREGNVVPKLEFPHILGADAAGEVAELGEGVEGFTIGERVIVAPGYATKKEETKVRPTIAAPSFALPGLHIAGSYASYMVVPAYALVKDETNLSAEEVATLPVALATSVHALKGIGQVKEGDRVLVQAGASGSGSILIQVAKALGAQVATTVRDDGKAKAVKKLGADLVINTRKEDFVERLKQWTDGAGVDVVIDNLGGDVLQKSIEAVKAGGVVVAFGFAAGPEVRFDVRTLFFGQKQIRGSMASDIEELKFGLELVRQGKVRPVLDRVLPLEKVSEAHRLVAANQVTGSIVLQPWAS